MIAPRRFSRFRLAVFDALECVARWCGGRRFYRWRYLSPKRLRIREIEVAIDGLPGALEGFTIMHLSDPHAGPFVAAGDLDAVCQAVEKIEPEVVCWTGDYVMHSIEEVRPVLPELRRCCGKLATLAVFGNHDYKHRREWEMIAALEPDGWTFLRNQAARLVLTDEEGKRAAEIAFAGIEDPEEGKVVDIERAMRETEEADLVVALTHGPKAAPAFADHDVRLVLAGHTHGSQVDLPFLRDLGPAHPGLRVELGATTVLTTRGLGVVGVPIRYGVPAEACVIRLRRATSAAS